MRTPQIALFVLVLLTVAGDTAFGQGDDSSFQSIVANSGHANSALHQSSGWGVLAIDSYQGDQWGWAVDHPTLQSASQRALAECGGNCRLVLTFSGGECAALAVDQGPGSTIYGWAKEYDSSAGAQNRARNECRQKGGRSCVVRVWGCNSR